MPNSFKPVVRTGNDPKWYSNSLRFRTEAEARRWAADLYSRWTLTTDYGAEPSEDEPNYEIVDDTVREIKKEEQQ